MQDRRPHPDPYDNGPTGGEPGARAEPYLLWFGAFIAVALLFGALAVMAASNGWLSLGGSPVVQAADQLTEFSPAQADRTSCTEIGKSDLRSPTEGLWFQANCLSAAAPVTESSATCNRTEVDPAEFTQVAPGLYVFTQSRSSSAFLWYATSEACYDLVSSRVVTAVCADQAVTFQWDARAACEGHGGVLAWVNGN